MSRSTRFLVFAVMLVLLPLRGWAGDVMAINMLASAVVQANMGSVTSQASMPADCAMYAHPSTDDSPAANCDKCETCELCLAVANLTFATWIDIQQVRHFTPMAFNASFSSAARAMHLKPPIF